MEVSKQFALLCVLGIFFSLTRGMKDGVRRQRRQACEEGMYSTSRGLSCCRCPAGFYVQSDCSKNLGFPTCYACEGGTYINHASSETRCMTCKECESNANLVMKNKCTPSSDTECACKDGYYCDKEDCKACHACDTCEDAVVEVACTGTNNTICKDPDKPVNVVAIVVPIIIIVLLLLGLTAYFIWKKYFKNKSSHTESDIEEHLDDVDLKEYLQDIARTLGRRTVLKMTRGKLGSVRIQNIEDECRNDMEEQAYQMLEAWYEMHGQQGAYSDMINHLRKHEWKGTAEEVQRIVKEGQKRNAGARGNGVV